MQVEVYPKAWLDGSTWYARVRVHDLATGEASEFEHSEAAGVSTVEPLLLLKMVAELEMPDGTFNPLDPHADVRDSLLVDDIKPGGGVETVWGNWVEIAEGIIGTRTDFTTEEFWGNWAPNQTNAVRSDARRAWVTQRGWAVLSVHQHEGDGTVLEE